MQNSNIYVWEDFMQNLLEERHSEFKWLKRYHLDFKCLEEQQSKFKYLEG